MKKLTILFSLLLVMVSQFAIAQIASKDSVWLHQGSFGVNFSNVGLYNWAAGGQNSTALGAVLSLKTKMDEGAMVWGTQLDMAYGVVRQGDSRYNVKKTDDQMVLTSDMGYKINEHWRLLGSAQLRTQMDVGYDFYMDETDDQEMRRKISAFMAPGYLVLNAKAEYNYKDIVSLSLAPVSNRFTFVMDEQLSEQGAFGVEAGERMRYQFGMTIHNAIQAKLMENVSVKSDLNMFAPYEELDRWVVNWGTLLVFKVNKYINTNFGTQLIYDPDVLVPKSDGTTGQGVQFKHVLNVGVAVSY
ncbi:DUF3078 domain-containing protein [Algivirga pacifica]|uniref:DUF3078 domain-containing protein n=1 Tax=Algivirga pacifica TaxID=1162670 RepID=A0ABP9D9B4_9BACT